MKNDIYSPEESPDSYRNIPQTGEARENYLISLAVDLAEKQLREGTASAQVITHYLKLGSSKEKLEKDLMSKQIKLTDAKANSILNPNAETQKYEEAIKAFKEYSGESE